MEIMNILNLNEEEKIIIDGYVYYVCDKLEKGWIVFNDSQVYYCTIVKKYECIIHEKNKYAGSLDPKYCKKIISSNNPDLKI